VYDLCTVSSCLYKMFMYTTCTYVVPQPAVSMSVRSFVCSFVPSFVPSFLRSYTHVSCHVTTHHAHTPTDSRTPHSFATTSTLPRAAMPRQRVANYVRGKLVSLGLLDFANVALGNKKIRVDGSLGRWQSRVGVRVNTHVNCLEQLPHERACKQTVTQWRRSFAH